MFTAGSLGSVTAACSVVLSSAGCSAAEGRAGSAGADGLLGSGSVVGSGSEAAASIQESLELFNALGVRNAIAYCLEMLADIELRREKFSDAARLFGAADRLRELLNAPVESYNQARYEEDLARTRAGAGEAAFATAFEEGRTTPLKDLLAEAAP